MALVLSGSIDISGSMTATTIVVSAPGVAGMVSSSAQITELAPLMAYTASLKAVAIVSSSQQIKDYYTFAQTSSANTFYGNQTFDTTTLFVDSVNHRVGIKTITPGRDVEINGDTTILGNNYVATNKFFQFEGGAYFTLRTANSGNTLQFYRGDDLSVPMAININNGVNFDGAVSASNFKVPSGGGLDFSATSNGTGTTASELLNDYETGTFTPTIVFGTSGTATYSIQSGFYTKVGRQVTAIILISFSDNTGSGTLSIGGLPFTSLSTNYCRASGAGQTVGMTGMTDGVQFLIPQNATTIDVYYANAGVSTAATDANTSTDSDIYCTVTYFTA